MARDYRAEYERRIAKAEAAGRSRSEARGHGAPRSGFDRKLQQVTKDIQHGRYSSATEAARRTHVPVEKLRNYMRSTDQAEKVGGRLRIKAELRGTYHVPIISDGQVREIDVSEANATKAGQYMSAVGRFIRSGDEAALAPFVDTGIADVDGQNYPLETDLDALTDLYTYESVEWDEIYRRNG